jgi:hypothetical protein
MALLRFRGDNGVVVRELGAHRVRKHLGVLEILFATRAISMRLGIAGKAFLTL